jgi:hypothetical protein
MQADKRASTTTAPEEKLGDETFMSAEELRNYMREVEIAKASKAVGDMSSADKARDELIASLKTPIDLTPQKLEEIKKSVLHKLRAAAQRHETQVMVMRFPNTLCTDKGRAINNLESSWPETLVGRPRQAYEFWRDHLRPAGYRLSATIVDWPAGMPGDVGFFLSWGEKR